MGFDQATDRAIDDVGRNANARSAEIEQLRHLPTDIAQALSATGLCRALAPIELGAAEAHVNEVSGAIERLAYHDGATGWCAMIASTTSLLGGYLPAMWAEAIYGDPTSVTGGFAAPMGTARMTDDGLVVSGRWQWGSGSHNCTWLGGGTRIVDEEGQPASLPDGIAAPFVFFEMSQVELLDTWHVSGLKGTGSTDYRVTDALVPSGRWAQVGGAPVIDRPLYRFPFLGALAVGVASVSLGLARRAIDELVELAGGKRPAASKRTLAERPVVQAQIAEAEANALAARALLSQSVDAVWSSATRGQVVDEHRLQLRLAATHATRAATRAVDLCYEAGGGSSVYETSALQRVFRDAHVATQHAMVAPRTFEVLGRARLGLPTDTSQL